MFRKAWDVMVQAVTPYPITDASGLRRVELNNPANERISDGTVLSLSSAYACVNLLCGTVGSLPLQIYRTTDAGRQPMPDHPLNRLLRISPNADQTALDYWEFVTASLELRGNAYSIVKRNGAGNVSSLIPYWPDMVEPYRAPDGSIRYKVAVLGDLSGDDVFHIRGFGGTPLGGTSTLAAGRNTFGLAMAIERAAGVTFANGVRPSGTLTVEKALDKTQRDRLRDVLQDEYAGAINAGLPLVLDNGLKWEQLSFSPEDAQMLQSRGWSVEEICRFFGVPPIMIGHGAKTSSWGTGVEQITLGFVKYALFRRLRRIEQAAMKQLLTPKDVAQGIIIEFNLEGLLRGDTVSRYGAYAMALQNGWMTINEVRRLENLPPVEGGDVPRMQSQNVPITAETIGAMLAQNAGPPSDDEDKS